MKIVAMGLIKLRLECNSYHNFNKIVYKIVLVLSQIEQWEFEETERLENSHYRQILVENEFNKFFQISPYCNMHLIPIPVAHDIIIHYIYNTCHIL